MGHRSQTRIRLVFSHLKKKEASRTHNVSRTQWDMTGKTRCIGGKDDLAPERKKMIWLKT